MSWRCLRTEWFREREFGDADCARKAMRSPAHPADCRTASFASCLAARHPILAARIQRFAASGREPSARSVSISMSAAVDVHAVAQSRTAAPTAGSRSIICSLSGARSSHHTPSRPQVLCGDFNTPQSEAGGRLITFGQTLDGRAALTTDLDQALQARTAIRNPIAWDHGERAVLEGLPAECEMPDAFRELPPQRRRSDLGPARPR